jgi:ATP-binding protein involved in chromosome partitioning
MKKHLPRIQTIVAIASGKGGVGKTTVTVNLALALHQQGLRVGIFDADIYGPNVPAMLGVRRKKTGTGFVPVYRAPNAKPYIQPLTRHGLKVMSVGLLLGEAQAINPPPDQVGQLVLRTLNDVIWGDLDILLLDLPPSAGQPQEDLVNMLAIRGAVIVTTPQDMSLLDAGRSWQMFVNAGIPILGIVENMSYFICPNCDEKHEIFFRRDMPQSLKDSPLLGAIPLNPAISKSTQPDIFSEIAGNLRQQIE